MATLFSSSPPQAARQTNDWENMFLENQLPSRDIPLVQEPDEYDDGPAGFGELSPSLDVSFASSMSLSSERPVDREELQPYNLSSPYAMDISPSASGKSLSDKLHSSTNSFDSAFFSKLSKNAPRTTLSPDSALDAKAIKPNSLTSKLLQARRPLGERTQSDNSLFANKAKPPLKLRTDLSKRPPLQKSFTIAPPKTAIDKASPIQYSLSLSNGRKVAGPSRLRNAIPPSWKKPPPMPHLQSAPLIKPADWGNYEDFKRHSDSQVPTISRTAYKGDRLSALRPSSPEGMDVDPKSPYSVIHRRKSLGSSPPPAANLSFSPGFSEDFNDPEPGTHLISPSPASPTTKRPLEEDEEDECSGAPSSPLAVMNSKPSRPALRHATSTAMLSMSRRRPSFGNSSHTAKRPSLATLVAPRISSDDADEHDASPCGPSKLKMRCLDNRAPHKLNRRALSMFDASKVLRGQAAPTPTLPEENHDNDARSAERRVVSMQYPGPSHSAQSIASFGCSEADGKILPCFPTKDDGLMRINVNTLQDLLIGKYNDKVERFIIIDCRFDYEYNGGHIVNAINLPTSLDVEQFFLRDDHEAFFDSDSGLPVPSISGAPDARGNPKKTVLVFHCEFSAKRAPTLAKHLRSKDRALNGACYPNIYYPELYVLQGGYAELFRTNPNICEPRNYVQMDDPRHLVTRASELNEFRRQRLGTRAKSSFTFR